MAAPALTPAPTLPAAPAPVPVLPLPPAPKPAPAPIPPAPEIPRPDFSGAYSQAILSQPPSFIGALPLLELPARITAEQLRDAFSTTITPALITPEEFLGAYSLRSLPRLIDFSGATSEAKLISPVSFKEAASTAVSLPAAKPEYFTAATGGVKLPTVIERKTFDQITIRPNLSALLSKEALKETYSVIFLPLEGLFQGASASLKIPVTIKLREFLGATSTAILMQQDIFKGIISWVKLPASISEVSFGGASASRILAQPLTLGAFSGASSSVLFSWSVAEKDFESAISSKNLPVPVSPRVFQEAIGAGGLKVMFPLGQKIVPASGQVGIPLGVEKQIMQPTVQEEEE
ncbi:MAG: hypothetical protein FJZ13_02415 [Candidatus Omnitrophica bacterium]|nr:hypothetical protein [Candidatus Omnitrophota bacterium]